MAATAATASEARGQGSNAWGPRPIANHKDQNPGSVAVNQARLRGASGFHQRPTRSVTPFFNGRLGRLAAAMLLIRPTTRIDGRSIVDPSWWTDTRSTSTSTTFETTKLSCGYKDHTRRAQLSPVYSISLNADGFCLLNNLLMSLRESTHVPPSKRHSIRDAIKRFQV